MPGKYVRPRTTRVKHKEAQKHWEMNIIYMSGVGKMARNRD